MRFTTLVTIAQELSVDEIEEIAYDDHYETILDEINQNEDLIYGDESDDACHFDVALSLECPNCKREDIQGVPYVSGRLCEAV